jgi:hypothetical protein
VRRFGALCNQFILRCIVDIYIVMGAVLFQSNFKASELNGCGSGDQIAGSVFEDAVLNAFKELAA